MTNAKKNFRHMSFIVLILLALSCNFSHVDNPIADTKNDVEESFSRVKWKIAKFKMDNEEHRQDYQYYRFIFLPNNKMVINEGSKQYSGSWKIELSQHEDDSPESDVGFSMAFQSNDKLSALAASWQIVERSKSELVLNNVSDSGKEMDSLVFVKF